MPPQTSPMEALSLDVHVLSILLQRNRHQHHRCIYFRRLSMVLQSLRKEQASLESVASWKSELSNKNSRKITKEDEWTIEQLHQSTRQKLIAPTASQQLHALLFQSIPKLKSRIFHATKSILPEITRGHFVPMLTIAMGCLGRIHSILMMIGRECLTCLPVEEGKNTNHLFEVSHEEVMNKLNECVNRVKLRDLVRGFGLCKGFFDEKDMISENKEGAGVKSSNNENQLMIDDTFPVEDDMGEIVGASLKLDEGRAFQNSGEDSAAAEVSTPAQKNMKSDNKNCVTSERSKKEKRKSKKRKSVSSLDSSVSNLTPMEGKQHNASSVTDVEAEATQEKYQNDNKRASDSITILENTSSSKKQQCEMSPSPEEEKVAESTKTKKKKNKKNKKKRKSDLDAIFDDGPASCNQQQYSNVDRTADAKKKSSKKTKKKRGSVIDDIFS